MTSSDPPKNVAIIGAGIMGTSTALALARRGVAVTLLEKAIPGAEASSAAAGILGAEVENEFEGPLLDLCRLGRSVIERWVADLTRATGIDTDFAVQGSLEVFRDAEAGRARRDRRDFQLRSGRARALCGADLRALEPELSSGISEGLAFEADAHIDPRELFRATRVAAEQAGVRVLTGATVRSLKIATAAGRRHCRGVVLGDGTSLEADATIATAGSWTRFVDGLPLEEGAVIPARGQVVELKCERPMLRGVVFGEGVYLVPRSDGRVLIGSTLEFVGYHKAVTAGGVGQLLTGALKLLPNLAHAELVGSWSNFRPYTTDQKPLIGPAGLPGLWVASGHYRMGILLGPVTAQLLSECLLDGGSSFDLTPFRPERYAQKLS